MSAYDIPDWSLSIANSIMEAVRMKDLETYHHCIRVSRNSRLLAKAAGFNEHDQKVAEFAGLFHDIGKIGIPDSVLLKPGKLTPEEVHVMQEHPEMSVQILEPLKNLEFFARLIPGVRFHHEWWDGQGYPDGLVKEEIPVEARIVLVVDTFDAMTADRVYRKGRAPEVAYKEIQDFANRQFDPQMAKIFLQAHPTWNAKDNSLFEDMNQTVLKIAA